MQRANDGKRDMNAIAVTTRRIIGTLAFSLLLCTAGCSSQAQQDLRAFFPDFARQLAAAWLF